MIKNKSIGRSDINILKLMYKVLRDRLMLVVEPSNREEIIEQFEESAIKIDNQLQEEYNDELELMFETTTTLENEKERLEKLIKHISLRIESRKEISDDFESVVGRKISDLDNIKYSEDLSQYQNRLKNINDYLDNSTKIETTKNDIELLTSDLEKANSTKSINESKNEKLETEIKNSFMEIISDMEVVKNDRDIKIIDYLNSLNLSTDIDDELEDVRKIISEIEKEYNTYSLSFNTLKQAGVLENESDLIGGLNSIGEELYFHKEQEFILRIYKLISNNEYEYRNIFEKRNAITTILKERKRVRNDLYINNIDVFLPFYTVLSAQLEEVDSQKDNIDTISNLTEKLRFKEEKLSNLVEDNQKVEILSLLREFCLIDTVDIDEYAGEKTVSDTDYIETDKTGEITLKELVEAHKTADKQIIELLNSSLDFELIFDKSKKIMRDVADVMNLAYKKPAPGPDILPQQNYGVEPIVDIIKDIEVSSNAEAVVPFEPMPEIDTKAGSLLSDKLDIDVAEEKISTSPEPEKFVFPSGMGEPSPSGDSLYPYGLMEFNLKSNINGDELPVEVNKKVLHGEGSLPFWGQPSGENGETEFPELGAGHGRTLK